MKYLLFTIVLLGAASALAFEIKGIQPGMTLEAFNKAYADAQCKPESVDDSLVCRYGSNPISQNNPPLPTRLQTIAEKSVNYLELMIVKGKIGNAKAYLGRDDFSSLLVSLGHKYGKSKGIGSIGVAWTSKNEMMMLTIAPGLTMLSWSDLTLMSPENKKKLDKRTKDL